MAGPLSVEGRARLFEVALLPLLFGVLLLLLPDYSLIEVDTDEGLHLILAQLYSQGFDFVSAIKYYHPPLFDQLLAGWMHLFGNELQSLRAMVLFFAAMLLWSLVHLIYQQSGQAAAVAAALLLLLSTIFLVTSVALMQTLPFIALGLVSLWLIRRVSLLRLQSASLYLSALFMAMAMMIKLFAVLMIPGLLIDLLRRPHGLRLALAWSLTLLLLFMAIAWLSVPALFDPALLDEAFRHLFLYRSQQRQFMPEMTLQFLLQGNAMDLPILILAIIAIICMLSRGGREAMPQVTLDPFPLLWLGGSFLLLLLLHPVWYHYYLMLLVPMVWLAAVAIGSYVKTRRSPMRASWGREGWLHRITLAMLWVLLLFLPLRLNHLDSYVMNGGYDLDEVLIAKLKPYGELSCSMVTDRPVYAFLSGCMVPPEHAVTAEFWLRSGEQSEASYLRAISDHRPQLVLLGRFGRLKERMHEPLQSLGYSRLYAKGFTWLYVREADNNSG